MVHWPEAIVDGYIAIKIAPPGSKAGYGRLETRREARSL